MSTRAVYSFLPSQAHENQHHVYKHHDGYPTGAAQHIQAALAKAWPLPRYESDDFAAAFVAANKDGGGGVRLIAADPKAKANAAARAFASDIEFRYEIRFFGRAIEVTAYSTNYWDKLTEKKLWKGKLDDMAAWAAAFEDQ